jgi:fructose PTS system EIIBC or EIIC component
MGLTEGAIPFAAADPIRVIPSIIVGSAVASVIAMIGRVGDHAPHGGPIVLFAVDHRWSYVLAISAGTVVTAFLVLVLKAKARTGTTANEAFIDKEKGAFLAEEKPA